MSPRDRASSRPPVTAEVGSEGGGYADAATGRMPLATETAARGSLAGPPPDGAGNDTAPGMVRYPTEPPSPADAREGWKSSGHPWRSGLIGLAAGTAALLGVSRLRRRS